MRSHMTGVHHILQHAVRIEGHLSHEPAGQAEAWAAVCAACRIGHAAGLPGPAAAAWAVRCPGQEDLSSPLLLIE